MYLGPAEPSYPPFHCGTFLRRRWARTAARLLPIRAATSASDAMPSKASSASVHDVTTK